MRLYPLKSSGNPVPDVKWNSGSTPVYCKIQPGSFTVPISLHCLWWVHPSEIRILSPAAIPPKAAAPFTKGARFPLYLANRMENDVSRISSGVSFATRPNTWLSVMTIFGFFPSAGSAFASSSSFSTMEAASASRISRMVCCCGRIRRPLGAALSIGTTRTTKSDGSSRSPTILRPLSCTFPRSARHSLSSSMPCPVRALTLITGREAGYGSCGSPPASTCFSGLHGSSAGSSRSALLQAITHGICFSCILLRSARSSAAIPWPWSTTRTATSVLLSTW